MPRTSTARPPPSAPCATPPGVAAAIGRAGAEAIAADPEALPPRIADRYLALKAAGRL